MSGWSAGVIHSAGEVTHLAEGKRKPGDRSLQWLTDAGTSIALLAQAREDFHASPRSRNADCLPAELRASAADNQFVAIRGSRRWGERRGISLPHCIASCCVWESSRRYARHLAPIKMRTPERVHRTYGHECLHVHQPASLQEVREGTFAFLQHYNDERPQKAAGLWQCASAGCFSDFTQLTSPSRAC